MAFYGKTFIWDGTASETYGLYVTNFDVGMLESPAGSDLELFEKVPYRKAKTYYFGATQAPPLEFPLTITTPEFLDANTRRLAKRWLFGNMTRKNLQILQCDMDDVRFQGTLISPQDIYAGNLCRGFKCIMRCDAPWGWTFPKTTTRSYTSGGVEIETFTFYNGSDNDDYLYPTLAFTTNGIGNSFTLVNNTDAGRSFQFTSISAAETITVDNDRQIITSSTGLNRLSNFNKNWFRMLPGQNSLTVTAAINSLSFTYQFARKVGG